MNREYFFTDSQINQIRDGALAILSEIGVKLGRSELVDTLAAKGFRTSGNFVRIEKETALKKIESQKGEGNPPAKRPFSTSISAYSHTYENIDGSFSPITTESNAAMGRFVANTAKILFPNISVSCPGHPENISPDLQFFRQVVNSFIWCEDFYPMEATSIKTAPYYFELCEIMGKPVSGVPIYVASPLNISGESLDIALKYSDRFNSVYVNSMPSYGANTPLNLVAAYAQTLAETVGGAIIYEDLTGVHASYGTNIFPFDFYDTSMPFGTPEKLLLEWTNMEVAARIGGGKYGGPWSTDIHTNAPRCGIQACIEKSSLITAGALMGATTFYCSGTLAMDELFSPVQLLLDIEAISHAQKIANGMINDDFDGDLLAEVRYGLENGYISSDRTLDNMRDYVWRANFFTRKTFGAYTSKPFPIEIEKAKEKVRMIMNMPPAWKISDELETEAERIFNSAKNYILK